jgi:hypothetical protein
VQKNPPQARAARRVDIVIVIVSVRRRKVSENTWAGFRLFIGDLRGLVDAPVERNDITWT